MELVEFHIDKFRLFEKAQSINFKNQTILIGPNNEGKSSICDALNIFFGQTLPKRNAIRRKRPGGDRQFFNLERDYPKSIKTGRRWPTTFTAVFSIEDADKPNLPNKLKSLSNVSITKKWSYDTESFQPVINNLDSSETKATLEYIYKSIKIITIPAIREESSLEEILSNAFTNSILLRVESSRKITKLKNQLETIFEPEIQKSKNGINETLSSFLQKKINVDFDWAIDISDSISLPKISLDDGNLTGISLKGDGLKSVIQIALLTQSHLQDTSMLNRKYMYNIEEPESHLNSSYLYAIKEKLNDLSGQAKILVTTHSPIFVNFFDLESNHIISDGRITKAKSKKSIADTLGIRIQENLVSNNGVLYVEGAGDAKAISWILKKYDENNTIISNFDVVSANGAGNVSNTLIQNIPFYKRYIAILDRDKAGNEAKEAIEKNTGNSIIFQTPLEHGRSESEMEDLITLKSQSLIYSSLFNRDITEESLSSAKKRIKSKWSGWIATALSSSGVPDSDLMILKIALWSDLDRLELTDGGITFFKSIFSSMNESV